MENIKEVTNEFGEVSVIIDHGNKEFTSMPKSVYDEMIANQSLETNP